MRGIEWTVEVRPRYNEEKKKKREIKIEQQNKTEVRVENKNPFHPLCGKRFCVLR